MATKTATQKRRQRIRHKRQEQGFGLAKQTLLTRARSSKLIRNAIIQDGAIGVRKLSEVILEFAEPLLDESQTDDSYRSGIMFAITAWNASLLPEKDCRETLDSMVAEMCGHDEEMAVEFWRYLDWLIERKHMLFSDDDRFVLDHELAGNESHWKLFVTSTVVGEA